MKRILTTLALGISLAGMTGLVVGCDDTLSKKETVKTYDNGTVKKDSTTVKERPDGTIVKEEQHTTDKP